MPFVPRRLAGERCQHPIKKTDRENWWCSPHCQELQNRPLGENSVKKVTRGQPHLECHTDVVSVLDCCGRVWGDVSSDSANNSRTLGTTFEQQAR